MSTTNAKTIKEWAEHYNVQPNFMYLIFVKLAEIAGYTKGPSVSPEAVYTVADLEAFDDFVEEQKNNFDANAQNARHMMVKNNSRVK